MNQGLHKNTKIMVIEDNQVISKEIGSFKEGEQIQVIDKENNSFTGEIVISKVPMIMNTIKITNKLFKRDNIFYNDFGEKLTNNMSKYGLITDESKYGKIVFNNIGYALLTRHDNEDSSYNHKSIKSFDLLYTLYDFDDNIILINENPQKKLNLDELLKSVHDLSTVTDINDEDLYYNSVIEIVATPYMEWLLYTGEISNFVLDGDRFFNKERFSSINKNLSGYEWYIENIYPYNSQASDDTFAYNIIGKNDSYRLEKGIFASTI